MKIVTNKIVLLVEIHLMAVVKALYDDLTKSWDFGAITDYRESINSIISIIMETKHLA